MSRKLSLAAFLISFICISGKVAAQSQRTITTAVPYISIGPDARAGALGDAGAASAPDAMSLFWNPSKMAFIEKDLGFSLSYTPWLRALGLNDVSLSYLSGYYRLRKQDVISGSLTYFSLGKIQFVDQNNRSIMDFTPNELAFNMAYSRILSEKLSIGVGARYIYSNLSGNISASPGAESRPAHGASIDVSTYYKTDLYVGGNSANLALGANLSNIGPKISYSDLNKRDFIPTNLRVGAAFTLDLDPYNKMTFLLDANKLLVPTPPIRDNNDSIISGKNDDRPLFSGMLGSFSDAPGGFSEELQEIGLCGGIEYWYNNLFAVRGGYFYEHREKGRRKYFTAGVGIRYQRFGLDFAYLIPQQQNNPLAETLRFTLLFDFEKQNNKESVTD